MKTDQPDRLDADASEPSPPYHADARRTISSQHEEKREGSGPRGHKIIARCSAAKLPWCCRLVAAVLLHYEDEHRTAFPSADRLADDCGVDRRTVRKALTLLEGAGIIRRAAPRRGSASTVWTIVDTRGDAMPVATPIPSRWRAPAVGHSVTHGTAEAVEPLVQGRGSPRVPAVGHPVTPNNPSEQPKEKHPPLRPPAARTRRTGGEGFQPELGIPSNDQPRVQSADERAASIAAVRWLFDGWSRASNELIPAHVAEGDALALAAMLTQAADKYSCRVIMRLGRWTNPTGTHGLSWMKKAIPDAHWFATNEVQLFRALEGTARALKAADAEQRQRAERDRARALSEQRRQDEQQKHDAEQQRRNAEQYAELCAKTPEERAAWLAAQHGFAQRHYRQRWPDLFGAPTATRPGAATMAALTDLPAATLPIKKAQ